MPALSCLLNFPVHIATATSHFVLAIMALTGTLVHVVQGAFVHGARRTAVLAVGVLVGAPPERGYRTASEERRSFEDSPLHWRSSVFDSSFPNFNTPSFD